jgi:hypothetical protein
MSLDEYVNRFEALKENISKEKLEIIERKSKQSKQNIVFAYIKRDLFNEWVSIFEYVKKLDKSSEFYNIFFSYTNMIKEKLIGLDLKIRGKYMLELSHLLLNLK